MPTTHSENRNVLSTPVDATAYAVAKAALDQDQDNEALKLPVEAWKRNSKAFSTLALALPTKLFRVIASANGQAKNVMQQLQAEYMPNDRISHVEADRRYDAIRLDNGAHPRQLRTALAQVAAEYPQAAATEAKKMAIIFRVAPQQYQSILASQQIVLAANCTSDALITAMEILYRQQVGTDRDNNTRNRGRNNNNNHGPELGMAAPGACTGPCWNCGCTGHQA